MAEAIDMSRKNLYTMMDQLKIDYTRYRPWGAQSEEE